MTTEMLQTIIDSNQWGALLPEIMLGIAALALLFVDLLFPKARPYLSHLTILAFASALTVLLLGATTGNNTTQILFGGLIEQSSQNDWMRVFFVGCGIFVSHIGSVYLKNNPLAKVEFYHVLLVVIAAFMVLAQSNHFVSFFVALETVTIGFYILVAYGRNSKFSLEAGLKYLIMGGFSSGILLFGIALLYGVAGNSNLPGVAVDPLNFDQLGQFIASSNEYFNNSQNLMVRIGAVLVIAGLAFKIGAVPFQIWVPDVYQGAPTPTTALLAVASKAAGFYLLYVVLTGPFSSLHSILIPLLGIVTILTILFGNIAALGQRNVKRIMGMSGIAHAGILLIGILASLQVPWALGAVFFYLVTYALASFSVFEVMAHVATGEDADQELENFDDLLKDQPFLGGTLLVGLGSLAGIPPLAGFIAKLLIFIAAFQAELYLLLGVALAGVVISIYYYFSWMRASVMKNPFIEDEDRRPVLAPNLLAKVVMGISVAATILFGFYQGFFF